MLPNRFLCRTRVPFERLDMRQSGNGLVHRRYRKATFLRTLLPEHRSGDVFGDRCNIL
jgi:hypothetical protein